MDQHTYLKQFQSMIASSTKTPKHMAISTVKVADLLGVSYKEIEHALAALVEEGSLIKSNLQDPPYSVVYQLPPNASYPTDFPQ